MYSINRFLEIKRAPPSYLFSFFQNTKWIGRIKRGRFEKMQKTSNTAGDETQS